MPGPGYELFDRRFILNLGGILIRGGGTGAEQGVHVEFDVTKSLKPEPNKCHVRVWNLNESHRLMLEQLQDVPTQIEAGYKGNTSLVFLGNLRTALSVRDKADIMTGLGCGDGELPIRKSRINVAIAKNTPTDEVLRKVAKAIGVDDGNLNQAATAIRIRFAGSGNAFMMGTVLTGSAADEMTHICRSLDLEWSVQNGKLQILERGKALALEAIKLSDTSGLIGVPTVDNKGVCSFKMLMQKDVSPGRLIVLDAARLKGQFKVTDTVHTGSIEGDWTISGKATRY